MRDVLRHTPLPDAARREMRVAIAGFGLAGEVFHAPLVAATDGLEVVAVTTSNGERAERARAAYPGVVVAADADALLCDVPDLDLLVVATPNRAHVAVARAALARGIAVVMDKPIAADVATAAALVDDFAAAGVPFTVFQNRRWDGDFLTVRRHRRRRRARRRHALRVALRALPAAGRRALARVGGSRGRRRPVARPRRASRRPGARAVRLPRARVRRGRRAASRARRSTTTSSSPSSTEAARARICG